MLWAAAALLVPGVVPGTAAAQEAPPPAEDLNGPVADQGGSAGASVLAATGTDPAAVPDAAVPDDTAPDATAPDDGQTGSGSDRETDDGAEDRQGTPTASPTTDPAGDPDASADPVPPGDPAAPTDVPTDVQADVPTDVQADVLDQPGAEPPPTDPALRATGALGQDAVRAALSRYLAGLLADAGVVAGDAGPGCFCAVSLAVSLDGAATARAAAGQLTAGAPSGGTTALPAVATDSTTDGTPAVVVSSGRSGDATALSLTGRGAASATATSGSTGRVLPGGGVPTGPRAPLTDDRATTVSLTSLETGARLLVDEVTALTGRATGVDTRPYAAQVLAHLPSAGPEGHAGRAQVDVAVWGERDPSRPGALRCAVEDDGSHVPSCVVAVAVSAAGAATARVERPAHASNPVLGPPSPGPGVPGAATALAVALDGSATASSRNGDQGAVQPATTAALPVAAAPAEGTGPATASGAGTGTSRSEARTGDSGHATAVAVTVRGAATTAARSGDTGAAHGDVTVPAPTGTGTGTGTGRGGTATASAASGGTGTATTWTAAGDGAESDAASGRTGDATALAREGAAGQRMADGVPVTAGTVGTVGTDGTDGGAGTPAGLQPGAGGAATSTARTGDSGGSLTVVLTDRSADGRATSGPSGPATALATGGAGGGLDLGTSAPRGDGPAVAGDGGAASTTGRSGTTGTAVAVVVTPLDAEAGTTSGGTGAVDSQATGGAGGCAGTGTATPCVPPAPAVPGGQVISGGASVSAGGTVRVSTGSAGSAPVTCGTDADRSCTVSRSAPRRVPGATLAPAPGPADRADGVPGLPAPASARATEGRDTGGDRDADGTALAAAAGPARLDGVPTGQVSRPNPWLGLSAAVLPLAALLALAVTAVRTHRRRRARRAQPPAARRPRPGGGAYG
ncbi:hypothetical protein [Thalassiella azotivora]